MPVLLEATPLESGNMIHTPSLSLLANAGLPLEGRINTLLFCQRFAH